MKWPSHVGAGELNIASLGAKMKQKLNEVSLSHMLTPTSSASVNPVSLTHCPHYDLQRGHKHRHDYSLFLTVVQRFVESKVLPVSFSLSSAILESRAVA